MKICPVGGEVFHVDERTDRHDETNSRSPNFANAPQKHKISYRYGCVMYAASH